MTTIRVRWNQETVEKPVVVNEYNQSMNGVDTVDQNSVYYRFIRKTRKWWRIFFLPTGSNSSEQLRSLPCYTSTHKTSHTPSNQTEAR